MVFTPGHIIQILTFLLGPLRIVNNNPSEQKEKVMRAAEMVELTEFLHRRPAEASIM